MFRTATLILLAGMCSVTLSKAQENANPPRQDKAKQSPPASEGLEKLSDAERIARLQRTIAENEKLLAELNEKLKDPESEFAKADAEFSELDRGLEAKRKEVRELKEAGRADEAVALETEIQPLQQRWKLSKDRFELAVQERKTLQEQIATLEQKLQHDREALDALLAPPATQAAAPAAQAPATAAQPADQTADERPAADQDSSAPSATPPPSEQPPDTVPPAKPTEPLSKELAKAEEQAQVAETEAQAAQQEVQSVTKRIAKLQTQIDLESRQLETARRKADNARETERTLSEQVQRRLSEGAPAAELEGLRKQVPEARERYRTAQAEVTERASRVDQLREELTQLQAEQIAALEKAEQTRRAADVAQRGVAWQALLDWLIQHGTRIVGIVVGAVVLLWLARVLEGRIVRLLASRAIRGTSAEREDRAKTLVSVFHSAAYIVILVAGFLMILGEFDISLAPLLGGVAVVGLAVAFGAQNLIRDYFYGFMILLENQYCINDVVKICGVAGLVERITLRVTVLRDLEGIVHFVPNGQITTVSNMTHGWSRALFSVGVAYKEDVDKVMDVLVQLGKEMRAEPEFRDLILDDPEMLGLDEFADSAIIIKFFIKTRPLQQWAVKRALLRRIKKRFDELGIEIPFPHRTTYYRYESGPPPVVQQPT